MAVWLVTGATGFVGRQVWAALGSGGEGDSRCEPEVFALGRRRPPGCPEHRFLVADLSDAAGLRQAYVAAGVLLEFPRTPRKPDANTPTVTFIRGLDHFRRWYNKRTDELPLDEWTPEARRLLRNELTWFKKLYDRLAA